MLAQGSGRRANYEYKVSLRVTGHMHLGWPRRISDSRNADDAAAKNWQGQRKSEQVSMD